MEEPTFACVIGAGPGGISMGQQLKGLKNNDFVIVEQNDGPGGTWFSNTYPGCGCDVPSHFYSYSFALNPNWSRPLAEQDEILEYLNNVVDRFDLRNHLILSTAVVSATWDESTACWEVTFKHQKSGYTYRRRFRVLISACGIFSRPLFPTISGMETFKGASWHTGRWDWSYDLSGKKVVVIGNGCSGSQVVPAIAPKVEKITHITRSKQWLFDRPNPRFSSLAKWGFRNVPGWMRWTRFSIYHAVDELYLEYIKNPKSEALRAISETQAREYMIRKTPPKYRDKILPDYPVGCKRRVMDPGYLDSLARDNVDLCTDGIARIDETGIWLDDNTHIESDVIVYATGFKTQEYCAPMVITGQEGKTLNEHWKETNGAQAYMGTSVSGFPNFGLLYGPNGSPAHNSVIFTLEVQAEYLAQTLMEPLMSGRAQSVTVKRSAEDYDCNLIQSALNDSVWHSGCTNWTLNENGRNCTSYPGYVRAYWWKLYWPKFEDYILKGGKDGWRLKYSLTRIKRHGFLSFVLVLSTLGLAGAGVATLRNNPIIARLMST